MPKAPASPELVESIRDNIIVEAVSLINEEGYTGFSMRKLGARLGIAAKTIYNYFSNRDELYLKMVMRGFELLYTEMLKAHASARTPYGKLLAMARAYVYFGLEHPHHYNILFSMDVPKYMDYIGTEHEELARLQNETALQVAALAAAVFTELCAANRKFRKSRTPFYLMRTWALLHGIVSLQNSRVTLEVGDYKKAIDDIITDGLREFKS